MAKKNPVNLSGFAWHMEYHQDNKKEKAADCIYLTNDRICEHKESPYYLSKCFVASYCPKRITSKGEKAKTAKKMSEKQVKVRKTQLIQKCSLPLNSPVYSKKYGVGFFVEYFADVHIMIIRFGEKNIKFDYPSAFKHGLLNVSDDMVKYINQDI